MPARRRRSKRWLMTGLINVSANDLLLMDAAVKRSGARLQGGSRLPARTLSLQWGNRFPSSLFSFSLLLNASRQFAHKSSLALEIMRRGTNTEFIFNSANVEFGLSYLTKAPLFQANKISHLHPQKQAYSSPQNVADYDGMCFTFDDL